MSNASNPPLTPAEIAAGQEHFELFRKAKEIHGYYHQREGNVNRIEYSYDHAELPSVLSPLQNLKWNSNLGKWLDPEDGHHYTNAQILRLSKTPAKAEQHTQPFEDPLPPHHKIFLRGGEILSLAEHLHLPMSNRPPTSSEIAANQAHLEVLARAKELQGYFNYTGVWKDQSIEYYPDRNLRLPRSISPLKDLKWESEPWRWYDPATKKYLTTAQILLVSKEPGRCNQHTQPFKDPLPPHHMIFVQGGEIRRADASNFAPPASLEHHRLAMSQRYNRALLLNNNRRI
ncbi:hypothetical protein T439DRAFT_353195 [Meredithblackwellia eburnea MCA 4105]